MMHSVRYIGFVCLAMLFFVMGIPLSAQETAQVDLIIEAESRVPSFFKGRALPVADERIKVTAIPHTTAGADPKNFTYRWKLNNTILFGGPIAGLNQPTLIMPDRDALISVTVYDGAGRTVGSASVEVVSARPELYFYEDNPLRSTSKQAIGETFALVGDEVTVRAEPYFTASDILNDDVLLQWSLDGREIENFGSDPQAITLRGTGGSGDARVGFKLINSESLQFLQDFFTIHFES